MSPFPIFRWVSGLWLIAAACGAGVLQDWSSALPGTGAGVFTDKEGSTITLAPAEGPKAGERALKLTAHIVQWGGAWATFNAGKEADLSKIREVRFAARASQPEIVKIGFIDSQKIQYTAALRVVSDDWREFTVPLSLFHRDPYQMPGAPKDKPLDWSRIQSLQFIPQIHGDFTFEAGPLSTLKEKVKAETGTGAPEGTLLVQDFTFLDKSACGPFTDGKGSSIALELKRGDGGIGLADFQYKLKLGGWDGYWMRAGDVWGGQDWTGAKDMVLEVYSETPLEFNLGFNDAGQCAYVAQSPPTKGKGWEKIVIPFDYFKLNPYYQPPEAKKGAALDLSHIETFNLAPVTAGEHEFRVRKITLIK